MVREKSQDRFDQNGLKYCLRWKKSFWLNEIRADSIKVSIIFALKWKIWFRIGIIPREKAY